MNSDDVKANLEKQLLELEILQSIYSNDNELVVEDAGAVHEAREFLASKDESTTTRRLCNLGFVIRFQADCCDEATKQYYQIPLEIVCRLPKLYPLGAHPDVFVRSLGSSSSSKPLNKQFSQDLAKHVKDEHTYDCSVLNIIEWVRENLAKYIDMVAVETTSNSSETNVNIEKQSTAAAGKPEKMRFSRMFVYSHHIFSVEKRRAIVQIARDCDVCGFLMPGKPGAICVEGDDADVQAFWSQLKAIPWQKLQMKDLMTIEIEKDLLPTVKKFSSFEERIFTTNDTNVDIGGFFSFLKENGLESIFYLYFGVEGKLKET